MAHSIEMTKDQLLIMEKWVDRGLTQATEALTQLIGRPLKITSPKVGILPFERVTELVGGGDQGVVGIYISLSEGLTGHLLLLLPVLSAENLVDLIMGETPSSVERELNEMDVSCLSEVGNITASHFVSQLADKIESTIAPSSPLCVVDMAAALLNTVLVDISQTSDQVFLVETLFSLDHQKVKGYFFLFPHPESLITLINILGEKDE